MIADDHALPEYQPVICDRSFWIFTTKEELLNVIPDVNTWVRKGEVIATIHSIFGQLIEQYEAPEDSIVIGKETDPVASSGARIVHIGVLTGAFAPGKVRLLLGIFTDFRLMMGIYKLGRIIFQAKHYFF